jgi:hypothetical protein
LSTVRRRRDLTEGKSCCSDSWLPNLSLTCLVYYRVDEF